MKNRYDLKQGDKVVCVTDGSVWTIRRIWFTGKVDLISTSSARRAVHIKYVVPYCMDSVGVLAS